MEDRKNPVQPFTLGLTISLRQAQIETNFWGWEVELTTTLNESVMRVPFIPDVLIRTLHSFKCQGIDIESAIHDASCDPRFPLKLSYDDEQEFQRAVARLKESIGKYNRCTDFPPHNCGTHTDHIPITGTDASTFGGLFR